MKLCPVYILILTVGIGLCGCAYRDASGQAADADYEYVVTAALEEGSSDEDMEEKYAEYLEEVLKREISALEEIDSAEVEIVYESADDLAVSVELTYQEAAQDREEIRQQVEESVQKFFSDTARIEVK